MAFLPGDLLRCAHVHELHHLKGTGEIQRMIIGRAVTGLDAR
jgi:hypothetical protein